MNSLLRVNYTDFIISWCKPKTIHTTVQAKTSVGSFFFLKSVVHKNAALSRRCLVSLKCLFFFIVLVKEWPSVLLQLMTPVVSTQWQLNSEIWSDSQHCVMNPEGMEHGRPWQALWDSVDMEWRLAKTLSAAHLPSTVLTSLCQLGERSQLLNQSGIYLLSSALSH